MPYDLKIEPLYDAPFRAPFWLDLALFKCDEAPVIS